jgi:DNA-binding YbaB/EbfC family protein
MNIQKMMQQAQAMQKKMEKLQEEIGNKTFTGTSGGGMVTVTINGKGILQSVRIDESLLNKDEKDVLEDLIVAAFNNAKKDADEESSSAISGAMGELSLPPGFKLPF